MHVEVPFNNCVHVVLGKWDGRAQPGKADPRPAPEITETPGRLQRAKYPERPFPLASHDYRPSHLGHC